MNISHEELIQTMLENSNIDNDCNEKLEPCVGTFWYYDNSLLFVNKTKASNLKFNTNGLKTTSKLHRTIWQKHYFANNIPSNLGKKYENVPRGRVWEDDENGFFVTVGEWIDKYPTAKQLIIDEFNLPKEVYFKKDSHWDIGHGFSADYVEV